MEKTKTAIEKLENKLSFRDYRIPITFEEFLERLATEPVAIIRNVFQIYHDMVTTYMVSRDEDDTDDPDGGHFRNYDSSPLFVEGSDQPFFADRLFANRLVQHAEAMIRGAQQNKIYIFDGPPGCGKSTFLNNLLLKFETFANTESGSRYETLWRLQRSLLGDTRETDTHPAMMRLLRMLARQEPSAEGSPCSGGGGGDEPAAEDFTDNLLEGLQDPAAGDVIDVPCPSHDHPLLMIPKAHRRSFLDDLLENDEFKWKLFTAKEYEWVFRDNPCTICASLYEALLQRLGSPSLVYNMIHARPYRFNRRLGEGISVFNPGDRPVRQNVLSNPMLQRRINRLLQDSNQVRYIHSRYAKTNNGIYALMDIKSHNVERLIELHNIVSEAVHKVEDIEESVNSLFVALMNPEDRKNIADIQSFSDRIQYINIPYVLDINTETDIYRNIFGKHIDESFLPRVLSNFARIIIASRLKTQSPVLMEWIGQAEKYHQYCDDNLQLLKMEIYAGNLPAWLTEDDRKQFNARLRRRIVAESESDGLQGFSGRDALKIFGDFYAKYARGDRLINMSILIRYFTRIRQDLTRNVAGGFVDSLLRMYNYTVLQEVKEALYYYNEDQIARDIQNYLFAINYDAHTTAVCHYTGDRLEINDAYLEGLELRLLGQHINVTQRRAFRQATQKEYTSQTLTQEILMEGKPILATRLYKNLQERYTYNLKEKALDPFVTNPNFRSAIKDYDTPAFKTYDKRIRSDVEFMMRNLSTKFGYTQQGAREVCIYVIDSQLTRENPAS